MAPAQEAARRRRETAPERMRQWHRNHHLKKKYGITQAQKDALLAAQDGKCAICATDKPTAIGWATDHDHKTGRVRGILCNRCNGGLGYLQDSPRIIAAAWLYLTGE